MGEAKRFEDKTWDEWTDDACNKAEKALGDAVEATVRPVWRALVGVVKVAVWVAIGIAVLKIIAS